MAADHFHDPAIRQLRETGAVVFLRRGHAENTEPGQSRDHIVGDGGVAIDGAGVDVLGAKAAHLGDLAVRLVLAGAVEQWVRKQQRRLETAEEQPLGETERLWSGEKEFFRLFFLPFDLRHRQSHDRPPGIQSGSRPSSIVDPIRRATPDRPGAGSRGCRDMEVV